ncbi:MAG: nidogen-like domain-containing protein [Verrucomicrobiota bacterium]
MNFHRYQKPTVPAAPHPGKGRGGVPAAGRRAGGALLLFALALPLVPASPLLSQSADALRITPVAPETYRLDWQEAGGLTRVLEASKDFSLWDATGRPEVGLESARSLVFSSPEPRYFFRLREGAVRSGFNVESLPPNDDRSSGPRQLPFLVNFLGTEYNSCYINNNGNITFGAGLSIFTPEDLRALNAQILAPLWADVDTRPPESGLTRFSTSPGTLNFQQQYVDGHRAFGATYSDVGHFDLHPEKLNSFQVVIIEREDVGPGDFDVEFNYNKIQWETGDVDGQGGYGGVSARAGISGRGPKSTGEKFSMEIEGSGTPGSFLDKIIPSGACNRDSGLIYRSWNSGIPGRLVFPFRSGMMQGLMNVNAGKDLVLPPTASGMIALEGLVSVVGTSPYTTVWTQTSGAPAVISDPQSLCPVVTLPQPGHYAFRLTSSTETVPKFSSYDEVAVNLEDQVLTVDAGNTVFSSPTQPLTLSLTGQATFTGGGTIGYVWSQNNGPVAAIASPSTAVTEVTLPGPGSYLFTLTATIEHEGRSYTEIDDVLVIRADDVLTVHAGNPIHLDAAAPFTVTLAGEASFTGGGALSLVWTQTAGDPAAISEPGILTPEVTLPGPGTYEFTLTATTATTPPRSSASTVSIVHDAQ